MHPKQEMGAGSGISRIAWVGIRCHIGGWPLSLWWLILIFGGLHDIGRGRSRLKGDPPPRVASCKEGSQVTTCHDKTSEGGDS